MWTDRSESDRVGDLTPGGPPKPRGNSPSRLLREPALSTCVLASGMAAAGAAGFAAAAAPAGEQHDEQHEYRCLALLKNPDAWRCHTRKGLDEHGFCG